MRARISDEVLEALRVEHAHRSITISTIVSQILEAHVRQTPVKLPQAKGPTMEIRRQLSGACNNFNQLVREIHRKQIYVSPHAVKSALNALAQAVKRV